MTKIILFDIDGTLVLTGGAGGRAMARAAADIFGLENADKSISMAGRTDSWIVAQMAARLGAPFDAGVLERFREVYIRYLLEEIEQPGPQKGVLPGIVAILEALQAHGDAHLGLLSGNFREGARIKLEYFDLWKYFAAGAFGEDAERRNDLLQIALARVAAAGGPVVANEHVVIIGDTPLDVEVAIAGGAHALAVATGPYDVAILRESGARVALEDLSDQEAVLAAIGLSSGPS